ncbi:MAG: hypothetical protein ACU0C9_02665, partial [Paracoccaceae bacterium]
GSVRQYPVDAEPDKIAIILSGALQGKKLAQRFFSKLKHFRAVATRNGGRVGNFAASADLASLRIYLRASEFGDPIEIWQK